MLNTGRMYILGQSYIDFPQHLIMHKILQEFMQCFRLLILLQLLHILVVYVALCHAIFVLVVQY